jgi:hypothetical protein
MFKPWTSQVASDNMKAKYLCIFKQMNLTYYPFWTLFSHDTGIDKRMQVLCGARICPGISWQCTIAEYNRSSNRSVYEILCCPKTRMSMAQKLNSALALIYRMVAGEGDYTMDQAVFDSTERFLALWVMI